MAESKAVRDRKNRMNNKVRGQAVVGGIKVDATKYASGRTQVIINELVPANSRQAAYVFGD
jgi:hypothetical protein